MADLLSKPQSVACEAVETSFIGKRVCAKPATHIYGPECEATTGQLMYLCEGHTSLIELWKGTHPNDPVECPTHGTIGKVKDYLILKEM